MSWQWHWEHLDWDQGGMPAPQHQAPSLAQRRRGRWLNWLERGSTLGKFIKLRVGERRPGRGSGLPEVT